MNVKIAIDFTKGKVSLNDAIRLLAFSEQISKETIVAHPEREIDFDKFCRYITRRVNYEPIEYIVGSTEFYGLDFVVNKNVLIPRCETEILVKLVLSLIDKFNYKSVIDIGCGSGAIACALANNTSNIKIFASDISKEALSVAKLNVKNLELNVEFFQGDLLEPIRNLDIDIIVSNPPYIAKDYILDNYVLNEPHLALFGGARGDEILSRLLKSFVNSKVKAIACEMGYDQRAYIQGYCDKINLKPSYYKDLAGLDRGFYITKENV